jgi:hypothetical protein
MKWSSVAVGSVVALLGFAAPGSVSAADITGHIGFSGGFVYDTLGDPGSGLATLDFYDDDGITPDTTSGDGQVFKIGGTTGYFTNIANGSLATILDITNDSTDAPPSTEVQAGVDYGPAGIANFLSAFTDPDATGLHFDLTQLLLQDAGSACTGSEGSGDSCTEGPFLISQDEFGIHVSWNVLGWFRNGADSGFFSGTFTSTFNLLTFAELFNRLDNTGEDLMCGVNNLETSCTLDANFDSIAVVPEPASLLTFGAGSALLALMRRRRAAKASKV